MSHPISYTKDGLHFVVDGLSITATTISGTRQSFEQAEDAEAGISPVKSESFSFASDATAADLNAPAQALFAAVSTKLQGLGDIAGEDRKKQREKAAKDKEEKARRKKAIDDTAATAAASVGALNAAVAAGKRR